MTEPVTHNHQTLVVIDVTGNPRPNYTERVQRFLNSINGPNIKADIAYTHDGEIYGGLEFEGNVPGGLDVVKFAKQHDYNLVIHVSDPRLDEPEDLEFDEAAHAAAVEAAKASLEDLDEDDPFPGL